MLRSIDALKTDNLRHIIIVTTHKPTPPSLKKLQEMNEWCTAFEIGEVVRNVTKHKLVPRHTKLDEDEVLRVKTKYGIDSVSKLPVLLTTDPVSKYYGYVSGDTVKTNGPDGTHVGCSELYMSVQNPLK